MALFEPDPTSLPLAARMRPRTLEEFVGQRHLVEPGRFLHRLVASGELASLILYGPPGTGKTSLARVLSNALRAHFVSLNAVTSGVADVRRVIQEARDRLRYRRERTVLFIDEIHRFNRAQQDLLLPAVEDGTVVLIGATTQNPFFDVNPTLLSRCRLLRLEPLRPEELKEIVERALQDPERGLGRERVELSPEALAHLVDAASGDARVALNALEVAVRTTPPDADGVRRVGLPAVEEALQRRVIRYDKSGEEHYDVASAFIKSLRGSDPDAAVYWLVRMLEAGEDPRFIARRLVVHAAEDVGLADPLALVVAIAAAHAVEFVGLPEAQIPLAEAALYIACAPKSNAVVRALAQARSDLERLPALPVPPHLRDASYPGAARLGHGREYRYPHDFPGGFVEQDYLPENLRGRVYYEPTDRGREAEIRERLERLWKDRRRQPRDTPRDSPSG
ncbi:MAG: replication-associated recombination protein A [Armatimonadota bacterium]|nr:replication-associated recombination protein A [Armatimonadota bacterium]MDR7438628.1 replication-associated recombination protein A [Armatimonadota bacterium]MDR7562651.1 replication-associated recombination protein A [Armatimonadota bacterium]MDR7568791.1 replication-associated recombination protein A [Armatimonadota bacterium]MDR7601786.1 replication-associated recombination protein A [Armatimonadota bacterium]